MIRRPLVLKMLALMAVTVYMGCNDNGCNQGGGGVTFGGPPLTGSGSYPDFDTLSMIERPQLAPQWCWAACGEMCMEYVNNDGVTITQCDQANKVLCPACTEVNNCWPAGDPCTGWMTNVTGICNQASWPDFKDYAFTAQSTRDLLSGTRLGGVWSDGQSYLSFPDLQTQIAGNGKPVIFTWLWSFGGGGGDQAHLMVAYGYAVDNTGAGWVYVHDPGQTYTLIPYSKYISGNDHTHYTDFYNIAKQ